MQSELTIPMKISELAIQLKLEAACSYHVTYAFQSESILYICLNVKELLARVPLQSLKTRGLAKDKEIVIAGWTYEILHIAAGKAADVLQKRQDYTWRQLRLYFLLVWQIIKTKVHTKLILRTLWFSVSMSN